MTDTNTIISALFQGSCVRVSFTKADDRLYTYKVPEHLTISVNDTVIVPYGDNFRLVKVVEVGDETLLDLDSDISYKFIVDRVDFSLYYAALKKEEDFIALINKQKRASFRTSLLSSLQSIGLATDIPNTLE